MPLESIDCPNCGSQSSKPWASENGFNAVKCTPCGLVYVNPRPRRDAIGGATQIGVHGSDAKLDVRSRRHEARARAYRELLPRVLDGEIDRNAPLRWLDIGAGYGEFVEALNAVLPKGSKVEGIEPLAHKARAAQAAGFNVREGSIADVLGPYDAVSLINVFSHIPDFVGFGKAVAKVLKPGGLLVLKTDNVGELARRSEFPGRLRLPDHLVFAGRAHLSAILGKAGFSILSIDEASVDTPAWIAKAFVDGLRAGRLQFRLPYTSPFRALYVIGRKV